MVKPLHLQVSLLLCIIIAVTRAIPGNDDDYLELIEDIQYRFDSWSKACKVAVSLLHPDHNWYYWRYHPSYGGCLLYTSPSPRDATLSRMPSSA